jgi:hypothetical protein
MSKQLLSQILAILDEHQSTIKKLRNDYTQLRKLSLQLTTELEDSRCPNKELSDKLKSNGLLVEVQMPIHPADTDFDFWTNIIRLLRSQNKNASMKLIREKLNIYFEDAKDLIEGNSPASGRITLWDNVFYYIQIHDPQRSPINHTAINYLLRTFPTLTEEQALNIIHPQ